ncbi:Protein RCC2 like, partial [Pseudolycoriella hygida]
YHCRSFTSYKMKEIVILSIVALVACLVGDSSCISGGTYVGNLNGFEYHVAVLCPVIMCNGAIVSSRNVLTTASCINQLTPEDVEVYAGSTQYYSGGVSYAVSNIRKHPSFRLLTYEASALAPTNTFIIGTGYGIVGANYILPDYLIKASLQQFDRSTCVQYYGSRLLSSMFCAGDQFRCEPGKLLIAGNVEWNSVDRRGCGKGEKRNELYVFNRFTDGKYRGIWMGPQSTHTILINENYKALSLGKNHKGQCGHAKPQTIYNPLLIATLKDVNVIQAACGFHHTLFLTDTGTVYACGDNKMGQLGIGSIKAVATTPTRINYDGPPICKIGCGGEFSVILDIEGNLHSFGRPEFGQLGHNDDGQFFITNTKLAFDVKYSPKLITTYIEKDKAGYSSTVSDVKIVDFACGKNHTVAIDSEKRAFSFGFGGYGRLGHNEQKDEWMPRLIKYLNERVTGGAVRVFCGSAYTFVISGFNNPYIFGKNKPTLSDGVLYPKPINELCGYNFKSIGCSAFSSIFASDNGQLIAWGASPVCGELGIGTNPKSSSKPTLVESMNGFDVMKVAMGAEHS